MSQAQKNEFVAFWLTTARAWLAMAKEADAAGDAATDANHYYLRSIAASANAVRIAAL